MSQSTAGERITAAVSALAAIIILGAAVTAQQSRTAPVSRLARLESDLRFQLDLAHRTNGGVLTQRLLELNQTLEAWQRSPRTTADDQLLAEWLQTSIHRSMPGESGELPPAPDFSRPPSPPSVAAPTAQPAPTPPAPTLAEPSARVGEPIAVAEERPAQSATPEKVAPVAAAPVDSAPAAPPVAAEQRPVVQPPRPLATKTGVVEAKPVEVNLAELNARIAGYHQGLAQVEAAILAADGGLNLGQLTGLVEQIEQLSHQYQLVCLYFESLTERELASVTAPRPLRPTIELVDRERAHLERGGDGDFLAAFEVAADGEASPLAARLRAVAERVTPAETKP